MNEPRKLAVVVMLLVMTALTLSVATPAYGDAADVCSTSSFGSGSYRLTPGDLYFCTAEVRG